MKNLKSIAAAMVLVAVVGCVTSLFIDESLQEFDAHPMASLLGTGSASWRSFAKGMGA